MIKRYSLPLLTASLICFPVYGVLLLLLDTFYGSLQLLTWMSYESKPALLKQFLLDAARGAGLSVGVVMTTGLIALLSWSKREPIYKVGLLAALAIIPALAFWVIGFTSLQVILFSATISLAVLTALFCSADYS